MHPNNCTLDSCLLTQHTFHLEIVISTLMHVMHVNLHLDSAGDTGVSTTTRIAVAGWRRHKRRLPLRKGHALCVHSTVCSRITGLSLLPPQGSAAVPGTTGGKEWVDYLDPVSATLFCRHCIKALVTVRHYSTLTLTYKYVQCLKGDSERQSHIILPNSAFLLSCSL